MTIPKPKYYSVLSTRGCPLLFRLRYRPNPCSCYCNFQLERIVPRCGFPMKGAKELNSKTLWASADLRAYRKTKHSFFLLNFWRAFPSEDPMETPHLKHSERGLSIMWRGLRPELVRSNAVSLSPDANFLVTHDAPDWQKQETDVCAATHRLVNQV